MRGARHDARPSGLVNAAATAGAAVLWTGGCDERAAPAAGSLMQRASTPRPMRPRACGSAPRPRLERDRLALYWLTADCMDQPALRRARSAHECAPTSRRLLRCTAACGGATLALASMSDMIAGRDGAKWLSNEVETSRRAPGSRDPPEERVKVVHMLQPLDRSCTAHHWRLSRVPRAGKWKRR